jgi:hypothetical protein
MWRRRAAVLAALCVACAGCAAILGIEEHPVGPDAGDSMVPEATADEGASDAADEGASDAADAGPFCAQHDGAAFCADFEGADVQAGWTQRRGNVQRETDIVVSGTAAAVATLSDAAPCTYADLYEQTGGTVAHVQFKMRLGYADGGYPSNEPVFSIGNGTDSAACVFILSMDGTSAQVQLQDSTSNTFRSLSRAPQAGAWSTVDVYLSSVSGGIMIQVQVDDAGAAALGPTDIPDLALCGLGGPVYLSTGFRCGQDSNELRFDDVLLETQ